MVQQGLRGVDWLDDWDQELIRLLQSKPKLSMEEVATKMSQAFGRNFTRNAVIGRSHRLRDRGLVKSRGKSKRRKGNDTKAVFATIKQIDNDRLNGGGKIVRVKPAANRGTPHTLELPNPIAALDDIPETTEDWFKNAEVRIPMTDAVQSIEPKGVTIDQLNSHTCKFPLGEYSDRPPYIYCGAAVAWKSPYCAAHARLCYTPAGQNRVRTKSYYR